MNVANHGSAALLYGRMCEEAVTYTLKRTTIVVYVFVVFNYVSMELKDAI
jgi:hypothetical protein